MSGKTKKILLLAIAFFVSGVVGLGCVLIEQKNDKLLPAQGHQTQETKLTTLTKWLSGEIDNQSFGDAISKDDGQLELARAQAKKRAVRTLVFSASATCTIIGAAILACWPLLWMAQITIAGLLNLKKSFVDLFNHSKYRRDNQPAGDQPKESQETPQKPESLTFDQLQKNWQSQQSGQKLTIDKQKALAKNKLKSNAPLNDSEEIDVLYCTAKPVNSKEQPGSDTGQAELNAKRFDQLEQNIRKTVLSGYDKNARKLEDSLKIQNKNLEKQVTEFKQITQTVKKTAIEQSEPLKTTLDELTQQVSAIREYASGQQNKMEKLQEGYDWTIIRTFCLRVIRCIDNLNNRIARLSKKNIDTTALEEIMDELVFALESSGVEPFTPEINSDYRGQEKAVEVVKDKVLTKKANMKGKIAEVIKPGYEYVIDDENLKVVRTAQVKLYG